MTQFKAWQVLTYMKQFFTMKELDDDVKKYPTTSKC